MLQNFIKTAWRNFLRFKTLSFINIVGLSIGLAGCLALLLYVFNEWSYDRQFPEAKNIYRVYENQSGSDQVYSLPVTPAIFAGTAQQEIPGIVRSVRFVDADQQLFAFGDKHFKLSGYYADTAFFLLTPQKFLKGAASTALLNPNSVVITEKTAKLLFGEEDPMGKTVLFDNRKELAVSAVIEDLPSNETIRYDYILPWSLNEADNPWLKTAGWGSNNCYTLVQLRDPAAFPAADALVRKMLRSHESGTNSEAFLHPMLKWHLYSKFANGVVAGGRIEQVRLFTMLGLGLLLIACINFMNLSTARSQHRAKEVGIRKAIGSSRASLIRQFLMESWFFALFSALLAVLLLALTLPSLNQLLHLQLHIPYTSTLFWAGFVALVLCTGFLSGSYPALYLSSFRTVKVIKGIHKTGRGVLRFRQILVVLQFVLTLFLIISTGVIYSQLSYIHSRPIGFDKNRLLEVPLEGALDGKADVLKNELLRTGAITSACGLSHSINNIWNNGFSVDWPGRRNDKKDLFYFLRTGYDFSQTTGIRMAQGRDFSPEHATDDSSAILINEAAASLMQLKEPIGASIQSNGKSRNIIGVFKDFVSISPFRKVPPMIVSHSKQASFLSLKLNPGWTITHCVQQIQETLQKLNPAYPATINFVDQDFETNYQDQRTLGILSSLFGGLTILISCMGLFGLVAFAAEQRTKEIGIRKVLGAGAFQVVKLLSVDFLRLVIYASLLSFPLSGLLMRKWLQQFDYRVDIGWWIFAGAWLLTTIIVMVTIGSQALKAAFSSPVENLRSE